MIAVAPYILVALTTSVGSSQLFVDDCDVGEVYAFSIAECDVVLRNSGEQLVRVFNATTARERDRVEPAALKIPPHTHASLRVKISNANDLATIEHTVHFHTDERGYEDRSAAASAFVMTVLDEARPQLDLGVLNPTGTPPHKSVELSSHDAADFRITKVLEKPTWLDVSIGADGRTLSAAARPDTGWGIHADFVKLAINTPQQAQAWVEVRADIHGEIATSSNPINMGQMRIGSRHEFSVLLHSQHGKAFQVGKIEMQGLQGTTQLLPCEKPSPSCQLLQLQLADGPPGVVHGHVWIEFPEFHQGLNLGVWGLLVPQDTKGETLRADIIANQFGASAGEQQSEVAESVHTQRVVNEAVNSSNVNASPPTGTGPLLKWTVANGQSIHGFQIFRASDANGPFVLLNQKSIPSTAETQDSVSYQWRDNSAVSGKTYWYYIGIVYNDGRKQQLTGAQKVVSK